MAMKRLESLGAHSLAHRKGRSAMTAAGVVLGVAVLFGVMVTGAAVNRSFTDFVHSYTGKADVTASALADYSAGSPVSTLDQVRQLPDVVKATGGVNGTVQVGVGSVGGLFPVRGIDDEATKVADYKLVSGRLAAPGADEVAVPNKLARRFKIKVGTQIPVKLDGQVRPVALVGILQDTGPAKADDGIVGFTSVTAASRWLHREGRLDNVNIVLAPGTNVAKWVDAHQHDIPGVAFDRAAFDGGFASFVAAIQGSLTIFAAMALFVGAFLIYLTLSVAVVERTRMYGTLRAIGATPKQVRRVVLAEAATLGLVSTAVGLVVGFVISIGLSRALAGLLRIPSPHVRVTPGAVIAAVVLGMAATLVASLIPARRASSLSPVEAMRGDYVAATRTSRAWITGVVLLAFAVVLGFLVHSVAVQGLAMLACLLGAVLLVPPLLQPLAALIGRLTARPAPGVGEVAVMHLVKERSRSAYTLALVMIVLAMTFAIGASQVSMRGSLNQVLRRQFGADLNVGLRGDVTPQQEQQIVPTPGVTTATELRFGQTRVGG